MFCIIEPVPHNPLAKLCTRLTYGFSKGSFGQKGEPMPKQKADREQYRIRIGEAIVPVNREIYHTYYGGERQERYQVERDQAHGTLHFSAMGEEGVDVLEILPVRGETPLDTMERRERDAFLSAALYRLPGPDRKLIRQLYWDELPRTGIARQEGVSEGAIRKQEQRILRSLRTDLQEALSIPVHTPDRKRKCK